MKIGAETLSLSDPSCIYGDSVKAELKYVP